MSDIGYRVDPDTIVLWRRRDFKWNFQNLDTNDVAEDFPAGKLFFELQTGGAHNNLQEVVVTGASDGTYKLGLDGEYTDPIDYYDVTVNPRGIAGDITGALEGLPSVGQDNVLVHPASLYPVWQLDLTLNAGINEVQEIELHGNPSGGHFKIGYEGDLTDEIPFGADAAQMTGFLEDLPGIGAGNVLVDKENDFLYRVEFVGALADTNVSKMYSLAGGWTWRLTGGFFPQVTTKNVTQGLSKLTEPLVNLLNQTINDFFDGFEELAGVQIDFVINDERNATMVAKSRKAYKEVGLITFGVEVTSNMIEGAINGVAKLVDLFDTLHVDFYWDHVYQVEFIGELANTPLPELTADISNLSGLNDDQRVDITLLEPGKDPLTIWEFDVTGSEAGIKIESEQADQVAERTPWQLVFLADGEEAGGDPIGRGMVARLG